MSFIAKTSTKGFRHCVFRNQPVHNFFTHLQAVLKDISPDGQLQSLFAKPSFSESSDVEWFADISGKPEQLTQISTDRQAEIIKVLEENIEKIKSYAQEKIGGKGIEKDYAKFLFAIAVSPDIQQVYVINNRPVLVQWGYINESAHYDEITSKSSWDQFISQIKLHHSKKETKQDIKSMFVSEEPSEPAKPANTIQEEVQTTEKVVKTQTEKDTNEASQNKAVDQKTIEENSGNKQPETTQAAEKTEKEVQTNEEQPALAEKSDEEQKQEYNTDKPIIACKMGKFIWVKFLAILLGIIILILLLLRLLAPPMQMPQSFPGFPPGLGSDMLGGGGGGPGGGEGPGGGSPPGNNGMNDGASGQVCHECGSQH